MSVSPKRRKIERGETDPGESDTEFARENELREEQDGWMDPFWYEGVFNRQDHYEGSAGPSDDEVEMDDSLDSWLTWSTSPELMALEPDDYFYHADHDAEVHLSRVGAAGITEAEEWEDFCRDLEILQEREMEEWPEVMPRQYDETPEEAHKRQLLLQLVRAFLRE